MKYNSLDVVGFGIRFDSAKKTPESNFIRFKILKECPTKDLTNESRHFIYDSDTIVSSCKLSKPDLNKKSIAIMIGRRSDYFIVVDVFLSTLKLRRYHKNGDQG